VAKQVHPVVATDADIDAAIERGQRNPVPRAVGVRYDRRNDAIVIQFSAPGVSKPIELHASRDLFQGLGGATSEQLGQVELERNGTGISWPALDVAHYVPGLLAGVFGTARWMAAINGQRGGRAKSLAKRRAARKNGTKGGRPRKARVRV